MNIFKKNVVTTIIGLILGIVVQTPVSAVESASPSIAGGLPFFYYKDLKKTADWYEHKLGLKRTTNEDWVVVFELTDSSFIGLVNSTGGSLEATENKGALLTIWTLELEAWWNKLKDVEDINMIHGIEVGAQGMIEEFRLYDPEGYIIEFARWRDHRPEAQRYKK